LALLNQLYLRLSASISQDCDNDNSVFEVAKGEAMKAMYVAIQKPLFTQGHS